MDITNETTASDNSRNIIMHHLGSFQNNDLEAVVSDYTHESVLITQEATYTGTEEIKVFFANLLMHFPKQKSSFELDQVVVKDGLGYIVWHASTPSLEVFLGTDTFIIKDDRIYQQTFCGQMKFK
jgi:ketosteroid isomerase-like protein